MNHEEQRTQIQCMSWFRGEYPQYAMLMTHPINEGGRNTGRTGGIHKAEGTQAGVSDLLFFLPAIFDGVLFLGLGIEFKRPKGGRQTQEQKNFMKMFRAAGYKYEIVRYVDEFKILINTWIEHVEANLRRKVAATHVEIVQEAEQKEKEKFYKIINGK